MLATQRSLHPVLSCCLYTALRHLLLLALFACSVASLSQCAGYHAPGLLSLRCGALAHRGLARGSSSVQFARHVRVCMRSSPTVLPTQERQFNNLLIQVFCCSAQKLRLAAQEKQTGDNC